MRVAVIKLGSRISFSASDTSGGNGEARSICKMLKLGGAEVSIYTKILSKDTLLEDYDWFNLSDFKDAPDTKVEADALIVLNGNVNFFGGAEDFEQLTNYRIINSFPGPVFYVLCDPELTLKQVWPSVEKKPWAENWDKSVLNIERLDIKYISQPFDVSAVVAELGKNEVVPHEIFHFPFEKFPCLNIQLPVNDAPSVDLSYGGTMRGGRRANKMAKFYFGHPEDLNVEMFGKITLDAFKPATIAGLRPPVFNGTVQYSEMLTKMNDSIAHCVLGDPWYEQINDVPQRAYESIWASVVTFIDADLDTERRVFGSDPTLADFLYVSDRQELTEKIQLLKSDDALRRSIINDQLNAVAFDSFTYCTSFVREIRSRLYTSTAIPEHAVVCEDTGIPLDPDLIAAIESIPEPVIVDTDSIPDPITDDSESGQV